MKNRLDYGSKLIKLRKKYEIEENAEDCVCKCVSRRILC